MVDYKINKEEEKKEIIDATSDFKKKCALLTEMIKNSKHMIVFTGAGISYSIGIPDLKSGNDSILQA